MLKRTLYFSKPYYLHCRLEQLEVCNKDGGDVSSIPIEDLAFVVLDHPQITFSQHLMHKLAGNNVAVVFCDERHLPSSMLFHLDTHQTQNEKFRAQVTASQPLKKQLWQQTVSRKIANQAAVLKKCYRPQKNGGYYNSGMEVTVATEPWIPLKKMSKDVKSGDNTHREAKAARFYWSRLFGEGFTRERFGAPPNPSLNYGYAIIRSAMARALCGSGLLPTLGIHHHNKYNAYCLADDLMEPYRPYVDLLTRKMMDENSDYHYLNKERKAKYLELLAADVRIGGKTRPMMVAMSETSASLAACFEEKRKQVKYPEL